MAVKAGGSDPNSNPALRRAVQNSRNLNMPKDKVEAAIKRAAGKDATAYEQIIYEGYAPHGVAVIVEAATDNPTRTVAQVRAIFSKGGGNLGTAGSVAFQFRKMGVFRLKPDGIDHDDLELYLIDHGLDEMGDSTGEKGEPQIVARCPFTEFGHMQEALEKRGIHPLSAAHEYISTTPIELPEAQATEVLQLVDAMDGPMPQTRFVTQKAFAMGFKPIVVVNKVDRPGARPGWVLDQTFDLFDRLGASDDQLDFHTVYASALQGYASLDPEVRSGDMRW